MNDNRQEHIENSDGEGVTITEDRIDQIIASLDGVFLDEKQKQILFQLTTKKPDNNSNNSSALQLWNVLNILDPKMASRWHYRDTRKTRRSLLVLLETGKRHSQWYEEQREQKEEDDEGDDGMDKLVIWIYSD